MSADEDLLERTDAALLGFERRLTELAGRVRALENGEQPESTPAPHAGWDSLRIDPYRYLHFFQRARGSEEAVTESLSAVAGWLAESAPVLDIGCGRGELLGLLIARGVTCTGIDSNPAMVERARARGATELEDAHVALAARDDACAGGAALIRLLEHMPAADARWLLCSVARVVRRSGRVVVQCAAPDATFWQDPTRTQPCTLSGVTLLLDDAGIEVMDANESSEDWTVFGVRR